MAFAQNSGFEPNAFESDALGLGVEVAFAKEGKRRYAHWRPSQRGSALSSKDECCLRISTKNGIILMPPRCRILPIACNLV